jgi:hypothetical protein
MPPIIPTGLQHSNIRIHLTVPQSGKKFLTITPASETPASELEIIGAELGVDFKLMNL